MTSYSGYNQSKSLEVETAEFVQILDLAKKRAFSNDKVSCSVLDRYSVIIDADNINYNLTVVCDDESVAQTLNYKLDSSVNFVQYQSSITNFTPNSSGASSNCIIVKHSKSNRCRQVSVNSLGLINIEDSDDCQC